MPEKEIIKPSLTQRRKISGSQNLVSEKTEDSSTKLVKPPKVESPMDESEDISIVKVALVVVAVIIVAVIAAFLIQATQKKGDDDKKAETTPTPTVAVQETPTPTTATTPSVTVTTTPSPIVTTTPDPDDDDTPPAGEVLTNNFGQATQFLSTDATSVKIRTYQYRNISEYYEFALPMEAVTGTTSIPDAKAEYDADGNLVLTVSQVNSFVSCGHINDNSAKMVYRNVTGAKCEKSGTTVKFTFSMKSKVDFRLTTGKKEVSGTEVDSVLLHIK